MSDMRRAAKSKPAGIDYRTVPDEALNEIRSHARSEARQHLQLDADRRMWMRKVDMIEAECRRRGI